MKMQHNPDKIEETTKVEVYTIMAGSNSIL